MLAQLGERNAGSVEVRGSNPLHSTIFFIAFFCHHLILTSPFVFLTKPHLFFLQLLLQNHFLKHIVAKSFSMYFFIDFLSTPNLYVNLNIFIRKY